jgi:hypothetical protein
MSSGVINTLTYTHSTLKKACEPAKNVPVNFQDECFPKNHIE